MLARATSEDQWPNPRRNFTLGTVRLWFLANRGR
jgi:hypothetical protein